MVSNFSNSLLSCLPNEVIYKIVSTLCISDLERLLQAYNQSTDNSVSVAIVYTLSRRGLIISDSLVKSLPWRYLRDNKELQPSERLLRFNSTYQTRILPRVIYFNLKLTTIHDLAKYNIDSLSGFEDLIEIHFRLKFNNSTSKFDFWKVLRYLKNYFKVDDLIIEAPKELVNYQQTEKIFSHLNFFSIEENNVIKIEFFKANNYHAKLLPKNIVHLTLFNIDFKYSSSEKFESLRSLSINRVENMGTFIKKHHSNNLSVNGSNIIYDKSTRNLIYRESSYLFSI